MAVGVREGTDMWTNGIKQETRNRPTQIWFLTKKQKWFNGQRVVFSETDAARATVHLYMTTEPRPQPHTL